MSQESKKDGILTYVMGLDDPHRIGELSTEEDAKPKWLKSRDLVYSSCIDSKIVKQLDAGTYFVFQDSRGATHAQAFDLETDELYRLPNTKISELVSEIDEFWNKADKFAKHKVKHKRGVLFYGPPGTGKTSEINLLTKKLIENDGLVFYIDNPGELNWYILFAHEHLRLAEKSRNVIVVIEDIDKFMDEGGMESTLLNFLDGVDSVDHQVVIATTNRLDRLNDLILRPSRFDSQILIDKPDEEIRKAYLLNKALSEEEATKWAKDTEGFSLAELKELFTAVVLLDLEYDKSKKKINNQAELVDDTTFKKPKGKQKSVGFGFSKS